ncbi:MAG: hypothetical protein WBM90_00845 [Acidimicrobiia bacterium]
MSTTRRLIPWIWTGVIATADVILVVVAAPEFEGSEIVFLVVLLASALAVTALGSLVMARQPGNRIAWLLHAIATSLLVIIWSDMVVRGGPSNSLTFAEWLAAVLGTPAAFTALFSVPLLLYMFPTGQFLTPRWRWVGWMPAVLVPVTGLVGIFVAGIGDVWGDEPSTVTNPIGFLPVAAMEVLISVVPPIVLATLLGGVVSIILRFRRSDLVVRTQIKWVIFASVVTLFSSFFAFSGFGLVSDFLMVVVFTAIPVAVATAVVRYKLFEIDRLISRSISYAMVVILLGAMFAAGAIWLPTQLLGEQPPIFVAATTLAVAALFNPIRTRVQRGVDRRFNRSSYQAHKVVEELGAQLQESLSVDQLADNWMETVNTHFQPSVSALWIMDTRSDESTL